MASEASGRGSGIDGRSPVSWSAWWLVLWPVVVWSVVLMIESTRYFGADRTFGPLRSLFSVFHGPYTFSQWWRWHHDIRKTGHLIGYGTYSVCWFRAVWLAQRERADGSQTRRRLVAHGMALLVAATAASLDEWHQSFLPNRTSLVSDVMIDSGGAMVAQLICLLWRPGRPGRPGQTGRAGRTGQKDAA